MQKNNKKKQPDKKNIGSDIFSQWIISKISILQWYFNFLYLGKFLEEVIMYNDLSQFASDLKIKTWPKTFFKLDWEILKQKLKIISQNPGKKNIFWYFVELSSFRWIMSATNDLLEQEEQFQNFVKKLLKKNYFDFEHIIKFARNVLIHATNPMLNIDIDSFEKHRNFLVSKWKTRLNFKFNYKKYNFLNYQVTNLEISINLNQIFSKKSFWKILSVHKMYLLCEFCYNLTILFLKK